MFGRIQIFEPDFMISPTRFLFFLSTSIHDGKSNDLPGEPSSQLVSLPGSHPGHSVKNAVCGLEITIYWHFFLRPLHFILFF